MGGGGVPPLSVNFFFVKNRPKNSVFWAKNAVFGGKFVEFRPLWGGGVPPHSVNFFPLVFRKNSVRYGGGEYPPFPLTFFAKFSRPLSRGGGGTPLADKFRDSGF